MMSPFDFGPFKKIYWYLRSDIFNTRVSRTNVSLYITFFSIFRSSILTRYNYYCSAATDASKLGFLAWHLTNYSYNPPRCKKEKKGENINALHKKYVVVVDKSSTFWMKRVFYPYPIRLSLSQTRDFLKLFLTDFLFFPGDFEH